MIKSFLYKYYARFKRRQFIADQRKKGNLISNESKGFMKVVYGGENAIPEGCSFSGKITLGFRTTLGINNMFFWKSHTWQILSNRS